ncbi:RDD family protein [Pseudomonas cichorii]|nr:RDD family protein [Pseudomonas cichorii]MBX8557072.1 RDD family protein [Pseudomonas cichorii]MBX8591973.1 RDD family protein [Pseudomonas cichorii]
MKILLNSLFLIRRLLASTIDGLLIFAFGLALLAISAFITAHTFSAFSVPDGMEAMMWYEGITLNMAPYLIITIPIVWLIYEATLTKIWNGTTIGKLLLRIRTISAKGNITYWQSLYRTTLKVLSTFMLLSIENLYALAVVLILFMAFAVFTVKNQLIYDLLASTSVRDRSPANGG